MMTSDVHVLNGLKNIRGRLGKRAGGGTGRAGLSCSSRHFDMRELRTVYGTVLTVSDQPGFFGWSTERCRTVPNSSERSRTVPNGPERFRTVPNRSERFRTVQRSRTVRNRSERFGTVPNGSERFRTVRERSRTVGSDPNSPERSRTVPNGPERSRTTPNGPEQFRTVPNASERFRTVPVWTHAGGDVFRPGRLKLAHASKSRTVPRTVPSCRDRSEPLGPFGTW